MGFKLGRVLKKGVKSLARRAPGVVTGFISGGGFTPAGFLMAGQAAIQPRVRALARFAPTGAVEEFPGQFGDVEVGPGPGPGPIAQPAALPAVPAVVAGLSRIVVGAIVRLGAVLGLQVTALNITRVGMRAWRVVTSFARRHPGVSVITFLTSLGLLAEEAVEFLAWGEAKARRRRRRRGLSAADMRITRRTMRRLIRFHSDLRALAGPAARGRRRGGGGGITAVSAG